MLKRELLDDVNLSFSYNFSSFNELKYFFYRKCRFIFFSKNIVCYMSLLTKVNFSAVIDLTLLGVKLK